MMRWKLWDNSQGEPPIGCVKTLGGADKWMVLQQQVMELVDVWHENMKFPKKEKIMVWQDVPLHIEKSDK